MIAYELRVGVSGHRHLPNGQAVARAVDRLLDHFHRVFESAAEFPHGPAGSPPSLVRRLTAMLTRWAKWVLPSLPAAVSHVPPEQRTPLRWTVVSPLAVGADRIVARAVLEKCPSATLCAVSPFAVDDYRRDFREPGDRAEFDALWSLDPDPVELNREYPAAAAGDTEDQAEPKQRQRNEGYLQAGQWVVDHCEILIAVWDGKRPAGRGGTGDVVRYAVEQGRTVLWIRSDRPEEPAQLIVGIGPDPAWPEGGMAVSSEPCPPHAREDVGMALAHVQCRPLPTRAKEFSPNFHQLAGYNTDSAFDAQQCENARLRTAFHLRQAARDAGLREEVLSPALERLAPAYARADQLAARYQALHVAATRWMYALPALAVTVAAVQHLFFSTGAKLFAVKAFALILVLTELLALLSVLLLLHESRKDAWHDKWLRDRSLAEQIRIAMFTTALGSGSSRDHVQLQRLLPFYHAPDSWVFRALSAILRDVKPPPLVPADLEPLTRFLAHGWIADQAQWHERNAGKKLRDAGLARLSGQGLFVLTFVAAFYHAIHAAWHWYLESAGAALGAGEPAASPAEWSWTATMAVALAIVLPAWGAAVHAISSLLERERIAERSRHMAQALRQIAARAELAADFDELRDAVEQAAEVMAMENHEWSVLLSFCRPELAA